MTNRNAPESMTLCDFYESVYVPAKLPLGSDRTDDHYHYALRKYASALSKIPTLADLSDANLMLMVCAHCAQTASPLRRSIAGR